MAAQLEGGAFLSSFIDALLNKLSSLNVNSIPGRKPNEELLRRLKKSLLDPRLWLDDAERKQIEDQQVKNWLADLQDALYKADDLLDEVSTKAATATQRDTGNSSWFHQLVDSELEDSEKAIENRMEEITKTLESVVALKDVLGLKEISKEEDNPKKDLPLRITTSSVDESSDIYGRDEDKKAIIELLLDDTCDAKISMIPIVGMGGVGKTTLAQLVYNDDKVKGKFNFRAWVCVGEKFDVINVTKTVIEAMTSSPCNMNNFDLLQTNLKEKLDGKTFLIVLDDVWNDWPEMWNTLLKPFHSGNKGSKILLTTRNEKVASFMKPSIHKLSLLSENDCWSVFEKHSCLSPISEEYAALEPIGREIVKKCKGLPLAAKTLGGLLCTKCEVSEWNDVLKSGIWEFLEDESGLIPALRISYLYLPSQLKRCFVYCSLYPKDYEFHKDELILLWMAEDLLLQPKKKGKTLEEIGCAYFDELVVRSFFQPSGRRACYFVMHDLMHDLATFYAGEFYFRAEEGGRGNAAEIGIKTRHLSHIAGGNYPIWELLAACGKVEHTRTLLGIDWQTSNHSFHIENKACISQLKYLRVFSFPSLHLDSLLESIGDLIHLRYLDLSYKYIVALPDSFRNLYNLQTLKLKHCPRLKMLPNDMQDLVNLRHLNIEGTCLKEMPKGMSKLKHLQLLSDYILSKHEENEIRELGALTNLHGLLHISGLENVTNSDEASKARILDKKHINILKLS